MFSAADGESAYIISVRQVWIVRIVLLGCVILHITAAIQLTRMSWAARPIGYAVKRDIETTVGAG